MYVVNALFALSADCIVYRLRFINMHLVVSVLAESFFFSGSVSVHKIVLFICTFVCMLIYVFMLCSH